MAIVERSARSVFVLALGFFAVTAQTVLFRDFLTALAGSELAVGAFFASWLAWIGVGAMCGRLLVARVDLGSRRLAFIALLYVPVLLLQHELLLRAPDICGVAPYEAFPLDTLLVFALCANAPLSALTGILFVTASSTAVEDAPLAPARVYALEAAGAAAGGLAVTVLLGLGAHWLAIAAIASLLLILASARVVSASPASSGTRALSARTHAALLGLGLAVFLAHAGASSGLSDSTVRATWSRMLPAERYAGSFTTPQALYSFGEVEGQFVVTAWGATTEALPDTLGASEKIGILLSQCPQARRVLVVGPGTLSTCLRLLELPRIAHVTWLPPDPQYPDALAAVLPEHYRPGLSRIDAPGLEVREYLSRRERAFDLVVLDVPDATSLLANRFSTVGFFKLVKGVLAPDGVVGLRVTGGENFIGEETAVLGASALATIRPLFAGVVIKPGDDTWLIASDREGISEAPAVLRDQFASIPNAARVFPPTALYSLYPRDRIELQRSAYDDARRRRGDAFLRNTRDRPRSLLFGLLLALRKAGVVGLIGLVPIATASLFWLIRAAIALYVALRFVYRLTSRWSEGAADDAPSRFDATVLVATMGAASMAGSILLMFVYQSRFGSLYLFVGLLTSLFMVGTWAGGRVISTGMKRRPKASRRLILAVVAAHGALLLSLWLGTDAVPWPAYVFAFFACGFVGGAYFALADFALERDGLDVARAAARLELADHAGAACGALLAGVVLLPVLGTSATLAGIALVVLANALLCTVPLGRGTGAAHPTQRRIAYVAFGVATFLVCSRHIVRAASDDRDAGRLDLIVRELVGDEPFVFRTVRGTAGRYAIVGADPSAPTGYVFAASSVGVRASGYGGPVDPLVYVAADGVLRAFRLMDSHETPTYVELLDRWRQGLRGRNIFEADALDDVDAVAGATITSAAVRDALCSSGVAFASTVLGRQVGTRSPSRHAGRKLDSSVLVLLALAAIAIALRFRPGVWRRRIALAVSLLAAGLLLNMQYSLLHVLLLLDTGLPPPRLSGTTFLLLGVPVLVALVGNVYCGWMCPFGALQELVGDLRPRSWGDLDKKTWRYLRVVKYALLFVIVCALALRGPSGLVSGDPLVEAFAFTSSSTIMAVAALVGLAFVYRRFWCRALCPAGAFLSLLNGLRALRRLLPETRPGYCDLGVARPDEFDCIFCDRCRSGPQEAAPPLRHPRLRVAPFIAVVLALVLIYLATSHDRAPRPSASFPSVTSPAPATPPKTKPPAPRRKLRAVDMSRVREMIRAGRLSGREAEYYHHLDPEPEPEPGGADGEPDGRP